MVGFLTFIATLGSVFLSGSNAFPQSDVWSRENELDEPSRSEDVRTEPLRLTYNKTTQEWRVNDGSPFPPIVDPAEFLRKVWIYNGHGNEMDGSSTENPSTIAPTIDPYEQPAFINTESSTLEPPQTSRPPAPIKLTNRECKVLCKSGFLNRCCRSWASRVDLSRSSESTSPSVEASPPFNPGKPFSRKDRRFGRRRPRKCVPTLENNWCQTEPTTIDWDDLMKTVTTSPSMRTFTQQKIFSWIYPSSKKEAAQEPAVEPPKPTTPNYPQDSFPVIPYSQLAKRRLDHPQKPSNLYSTDFFLGNSRTSQIGTRRFGTPDAAPKRALKYPKDFFPRPTTTIKLGSVEDVDVPPKRTLRYPKNLFLDAPPTTTVKLGSVEAPDAPPKRFLRYPKDFFPRLTTIVLGSFEAPDEQPTRHVSHPKDYYLNKPRTTQFGTSRTEAVQKTPKRTSYYPSNLFLDPPRTTRLGTSRTEVVEKTPKRASYYPSNLFLDPPRTTRFGISNFAAPEGQPKRSLPSYKQDLSMDIPYTSSFGIQKLWLPEEHPKIIVSRDLFMDAPRSTRQGISRYETLDEQPRSWISSSFAQDFYSYPPRPSWLDTSAFHHTPQLPPKRSYPRDFFLDSPRNTGHGISRFEAPDVEPSTSSYPNDLLLDPPHTRPGMSWKHKRTYETPW